MRFAGTRDFPRTTRPRHQAAVNCRSKGVKMSGPRTTSTSTKVDNCARVQRSKMVERFQVAVLDLKAKPSKTNRHRCSICRQVGHHPQTCPSILDPEHAERANLFLRHLIEKRKAQRYLDTLAKRGSPAFVKRVVQRVGLLSAACGEDSSLSGDSVQ